DEAQPEAVTRQQNRRHGTPYCRSDRRSDCGIVRKFYHMAGGCRETGYAETMAWRLLLIILLPVSLAAQDFRLVTSGVLKSYETSRTNLFELRSNEAVVLEIKASGVPPQVLVAAFDEKSQLLEKQRPPESGSPPPFRWIPPSQGRYYLHIRNIS